jgi:predicted Zn-ribbon and HTH transcriptional regulator
VYQVVFPLFAGEARAAIRARKRISGRVLSPDMQGAERTTRQRIADHLREEPAAAGTLAAEFAITAPDALSHVRHIARSLEGDGDEQLLVAPPECRDCGFTDFHDLVNRPSRCPECKSEGVEEPAFRIE